MKMSQTGRELLCELVGHDAEYREHKGQSYVKCAFCGWRRYVVVPRGVYRNGDPVKLVHTHFVGPAR